MSDYLEVVWYSNYMNAICVTMSHKDCYEFLSNEDRNIVVLELNLIIEGTPNENE